MRTKQVWYSSQADIKSPDTIHQILMFGKLSDILSLKKTLGEKIIKKLFLSHPKKIYTNTTLNFVKNFILKIKPSIDEQKYLKDTFRTAR